MSSTFTFVGCTVGPYTVLHKLGEGGMGAVYKAVNKATGRHVAIKFLHAQYAQDEELLRRFFNEAVASGSLDHPGMVQIFDCGMLDGETPYLVMEFLRGLSIEQRLATAGDGRGLPLCEALNIAWQTAAVLAELQSRGIVHRDLKPGNLMLVPDVVAAQGVRVKILDLGLAKLNRDLFTQAVHTRCGVVMGTPLYMSPEQCCDTSDVDGQTDVYSLGIVLFEMLAGQPPFVTADHRSVLALHLFAPVPRLQEVVAGVPLALAELLTALLTKNPAQRPKMAAVRDQLAKLLEHSAAPGATAEAAPLLVKPLPPVPGSSSAVPTRVLALADTVIRDTLRDMQLPSFALISQQDLTAEFVRITKPGPPPPLAVPRFARHPVLVGFLVFFVSVLLLMGR